MVEEHPKVGDIINLTEDNKLTKKILRLGDEDGVTPVAGQTIEVNYEGRLEDGKVFDSSYKRDEPFKVEIGVGQVIKGWDIGMCTMKLGEKSEFTIHADYGYGDQGAGGDIPGGATLIFVVELLTCDGQLPVKMIKELITETEKLKNEGNASFKAGKIEEAATKYAEAYTFSSTVATDNADLKKLKLVVLQNLSNMQLKQNNWKEAVTNCSKALDIDSQAMKALFFRSQAFYKGGQFNEACSDIKAAIKIDLQNKALRDHWEVCKKALAEHNEKQAGNMKSFFGGGMYEDKPIHVEQNKEVEELPKFNPANPQTFFDITIGNEGDAEFQKGRVVFELFKDHVPNTAENFRALCTGEKDSVPSYKGNKFHRIIKGFMMQGGDTTAGNGTGGKSIYGEKFADEGVWLPHTHKGVLSMANAGPDTNGSQFFVCYGATPHLNGKHTIYGRAISGFNICEDAEKGEMGESDKPLSPVTIADCGELTGDDKLTEETADFLANYA